MPQALAAATSDDALTVLMLLALRTSGPEQLLECDAAHAQTPSTIDKEYAAPA
jgi:hypothetical protein